MTQRFVNNFSTTVAATFGAADTFLQVASTAGLPTLTAGEYLLLTVFQKMLFITYTLLLKIQVLFTTAKFFLTLIQ